MREQSGRRVRGHPRPDLRILAAVLVVVMGLGLPLLPGLPDPAEVVGPPWAARGPDHPLGLDRQGRDVLARLAHGGIGLIVLSLVTGTASTVCGTALALLVWRARRVEALVLAVTRTALAVPGVLVVLLAGIFLPAWAAVALAMGLLGVPLSARMVGSSLASQRGSGYVRQAQLRGETPAAVLLREVLPGAAGSVVGDAAMRVIAALQLTVAVGVILPSGLSWATMIAQGMSGVRLNPWATAAPAIAIAAVGAAVAVGFDALSDGLTGDSARAGGQRRRQPPRDRSQSGSRKRAPLNRVCRTPEDGLEVADLRIAAPDGRVVVDLPALSARPGDVVAVRGPSGSGKTTVLRVLAARPVPGFDVSGTLRAPGAVRMVTQDPASTLSPHLRVGRAIRDGRRQCSRAACRDALERVGLPVGFLDRQPWELSGGEAARVAIARAVVDDPAVLALDEPTSGLDPAARERVADLVRDRSARGRITVLVSHDTALLDELATRTMDLAPAPAGGSVSVARTGAPRAGCAGSGTPALAAGVTTGELLRWEGVPGAAGTPAPVLTLRAGEILALTGTSGVGKSTLLRMLAGVSAGSGWLRLVGEAASIDAWDWSSPRASAQRALIAYAGQDPVAELGPVRSLVSSVAQNAGGDLVEAARVLARLGISADVMSRRPHQCSGGQRKRAVLARALVSAPTILIGDEPTASLDAAAAARVHELLAEIASRGGGVLVATHDPDLVALAHRRIRMEGPGRLVEEDPAV